MNRVRTTDLVEAEELLSELSTWSEDEIAALPKLYREKARAYRKLANRAEE
jgi:hypothetical protein